MSEWSGKMDEGKEKFSFESDIKDIKKIKLEDSREIETEMPCKVSVKSETNPCDKQTCVVCNQKFDQFELEIHFLECIQDQSKAQPIDNSHNVDIIASVSKTSERINVKEKSYKCEYCPKAFNTKGSVKIHERIHTGKPFKCKFCTKAFVQNSDMKIHERMHTGEKPFKCKFCPHAFTRSDSRKAHEKNHTGDKYFKCKFCPKAFTQGGDLKRHERRHTGEKPFKCKLCPKAFSRNWILKNHVQKIHKKQFPYESNMSVKGLNFTIIESPDVKMYKCSICEESLVCLKDLSSHLESHDQSKYETETSQSVTKNPLLENHEVFVNEINFQRMGVEDVSQSCKDPVQEAYSETIEPKIDFNPSNSEIRTTFQLSEEVNSNPNPSSMSYVTYIGNENFLQITRTLSKLEELSVICTLCGKQNQTSEELRHHLKSHSQETNSNANLLSRSQKSSQQIRPFKNFKCGICVKSFPDLDSINLHLKTKHYGNTHKCNHCEDSFNSFVSLELHERLKH